MCHDRLSIVPLGLSGTESMSVYSFNLIRHFSHFGGWNGACDGCGDGDDKEVVEEQKMITLMKGKISLSHNDNDRK